MAILYGVLRGRPDRFKREDNTSSPHLQIRVLDDTGKATLAAPHTGEVGRRPPRRQDAGHLQDGGEVAVVQELLPALQVGTQPPVRLPAQFRPLLVAGGRRRHPLPAAGPDSGTGGVVAVVKPIKVR